MPQYGNELLAKRIKEADRRYDRAMIAARRFRGIAREAAERQARVQRKIDYQQAFK